MTCKKCCKCNCYPESNGYQPKKSKIPPPSVEQSFIDFVLKQKTKKETSILENKLSSYQYLSQIAEHLKMSLDRLFAEAHEKVLDNNHYYIGNAEAEGYSVGSDFWFHYENYTETQVSHSHKKTLFLVLVKK